MFGHELTLGIEKEICPTLSFLNKKVRCALISGTILPGPVLFYCIRNTREEIPCKEDNLCGPLSGESAARSALSTKALLAAINLHLFNLLIKLDRLLTYKPQ